AKRFTHTINVRDMAVEFAKKHGVNVEKAEISALLHDIAKEKTKDEMLLIFKENAIMAKDFEKKLFPIWHGPCAAIVAKTELGVDDAEILNAISCHSSGRINMTKLDKVLYLADMVSAERDYEGVDELRKLALCDLDKGMETALEMNIGFIKEKGKIVDEESILTLKWLKESRKENV
ncbi:MAG: bis(5'-nucleosyl)-tetraphosphatase (symmetrical) YqeK, partial [Oscillospiraceae bacterium]